MNVADQLFNRQRREKTTREQYSLFVDYLNNHRELLMPRSPHHNPQTTELRWQAIARTMNSYGPPVLTVKQWKHSMRTWQCNLRYRRRKLSKLSVQQNALQTAGGGGGGGEVLRQMNELEERALLIMDEILMHTKTGNNGDDSMLTECMGEIEIEDTPSAEFNIELQNALQTITVERLSVTPPLPPQLPASPPTPPPPITQKLINNGPRTNPQQFNMILEFVTKHPQLIIGDAEPDALLQLWDELTAQLNGLGTGAVRQREGWQYALDRWHTHLRNKDRNVEMEMTDMDQRAFAVFKRLGKGHPAAAAVATTPSNTRRSGGVIVLAQYEEFLEHVFVNPRLISNTAVNFDWEQLASDLNRIRYGAKKSAADWRTALVGWKDALHAKRQAIEGGSSGSFDELDKRALRMFDNALQTGSGNQGSQTANGLHASAAPLPDETPREKEPDDVYHIPAKRGPKTHPKQYRIFLEAASKYPFLVAHINKSKLYRSEWKELADRLNACENGAKKSTDQWVVTFNQWKAHLRWKYHKNQRSGGKERVHNLSYLEEWGLRLFANAARNPGKAINFPKIAPPATIGKVELNEEPLNSSFDATESQNISEPSTSELAATVGEFLNVDSVHDEFDDTKEDQIADPFLETIGKQQKKPIARGVPVRASIAAPAYSEPHLNPVETSQAITKFHDNVMNTLQSNKHEREHNELLRQQNDLLRSMNEQSQSFHERLLAQNDELLAQEQRVLAQQQEALACQKEMLQIKRKKMEMQYGGFN